MPDDKNAASPYAARRKRNNKNTTLWALVFAVTFVLSTWAIRSEWITSSLLTMALIAVNLITGTVMVLSYRRMIKELDELQRKIQLEALALSIGVAVVGGFTISLMAIAGYLDHARAAYVVSMICVTYSAATLYGCRRYQ